jgi:hypothetical protein
MMKPVSNASMIDVPMVPMPPPAMLGRNTFVSQPPPAMLGRASFVSQPPRPPPRNYDDDL